MFKLHRHRSDRLGERVEFKFSCLQAFKVPNGWDRLQLTIISIETGKAITKPIKTTVRSGTCQWTETLSESILIPQNDALELEECLIKIVVSLGSHRSGALGEVTLNLTEYISSQDSGLLPLPLQNCTQGTILQVRIKCLSPKTRFRDEKASKQNYHLEGLHGSNDDMDCKSDNRETSFSASGSHRSSDSGDSSVGRLNFSPRNLPNGGSYVGRQDSSGSHNSGTYSVGTGDDFSRSNQSSFNSRASDSSTPHRWQESTPRASSHGLASVSPRPPTSPKDFIEAAEETIEELQDEAKMWERHAQKLKVDIQKLKKECLDKSKHQSELELELASAYSERDSLMQEILKLKSLLKEKSTKQTASEVAKIEEMVRVQKELEDELKFQKESNANQSLQLKKTQEANIEFVAIIEELEETIEKGRLEVVNDLEESYMRSPMVSGQGHQDLIEEIEGLRAKVQELERDCAELTDENLELMYKVKVSSKDTNTGRDYHDSGSEIGLLRLQICELEEELSRKEMLKEGLSETLTSQIKDLEKKCADLELDLLYFKDQARDLSTKLSSVDCDASAAMILEKKLMELESCKRESETQISELEEENVQLSERISGLEAQLRHLTNEKESSRLELEDSKNIVTDLKNEVAKLQAEMELQKGESKHKLQEAQEKLSEAQEEMEYLKRSHSKLQSTVENLIEENSSLQKSNGDLRRQKLELHERVAYLEVNLSESQKKNSEFMAEVESMELKISSLQKDIALKERSLISQIESMFQEHKEQEEKISQARFMLNQIDLEKTVEVENLKREIANISLEVSATHDEREKMASDALREVSGLRSDKIRLESSLHDAYAKIKLHETELQTLRQETGMKVQGLVDLLNASKQSEEMLISDKEHMQRQTEAAKSSEGKCKRTISELELKLKAADYEKKQIIEENSDMKVQFQRMTHLQDEVSALKSSLEDAKFERGKLEESLQLVSKECESLKAERILLAEKISNMQKALNDGEDDRRGRIAMEEKILRLEGDLTAKEASCAHEAELKNEFNRIKRANSEYQRKIQNLEEENDRLTRKSQIQDSRFSNKNSTEVSSTRHDDTETESKDIPNGGQHVDANQISVPGDGKRQEMEAEIQELHAKIRILGTELSEALEKNKTYKSQLDGYLSGNRSSQPEAVDRNVGEDDATASHHASKVASLEAELKDMKERYLHISLQYAEVEAERGELVMKLKSMSKGKKWFS